MNRSVMWMGLVAASLTVGVRAEDKQAAGNAAAQQAQQAQLQQKMLQQFDTNKDGVLSDQEKLIASEVMRRTGVPAFGIEPGGFPGAEQFNKQFDKDGDGKLNDSEKLMAQMAYQRMRGNKRGPVAGIGYGGQAGAGGFAPNAGIPGNAPVAEPKAAKVSPLVKRFDKDGDGKLNDEEKATAQAELKKSKTKDKGAKDAAAKEDK